MFRRINKVILLAPVVFLAVFLFSYLFSSATSGCCSWHGGVSYCDTSVGTYVCNDGSYSPSCGCAYIPPKPICVKPVVGNNATWNFTASGCNQNISVSWDKGMLNEFYSVQLSKSPGANPGQLSDTSVSSFTFNNIKPGRWYLNIKAGRSCGWGNIYYWTIDVPDVSPIISFEEKIINENERKLNYSVSCADKIEITPDIGIVKGIAGSITMHPQQNLEYKLTATNKKQTNYAVLDVKYPLPKPEENKQDNSNESLINKNNSSGGWWGWFILLIVIGGIALLLNKTK